MEGNAFPMMFVFPVIPQQEGEISLPPADVRPDLPPIVPTGAETVAASYNIDSGVPIRTPLPGSIPLQPAIDPYLLALSAAAQPSTAVHLPTPRQSMTPVPPATKLLNARPMPRPKGAAAIAQLNNRRPASVVPAAGAAQPSSAAEPSPSARKRTKTADTLAREEAERLIGPAGKRQRRPGPKVLATHT